MNTNDGHQYVEIGGYMVRAEMLGKVPAQQLSEHLGVPVKVIERVKRGLARDAKMPEVPEGLVVWYEHTTTRFSPKGRFLDHAQRRCTVAHLCTEVHDEFGRCCREEVATGVAVCNPSDNFEKSVGRRKSLKRALKALGDLGAGSGDAEAVG